jgi:AmiR/NasT family two-component response regulator
MGLTQRIDRLEKQTGDRQDVVIVSSKGKTEQELRAEIARMERLHHPEIVLIDDGDPGPFREVADNGPTATGG